jgi:hypothetical protein
VRRARQGEGEALATRAARRPDLSLPPSLYRRLAACSLCSGRRAQVMRALRRIKTCVLAAERCGLWCRRAAGVKTVRRQRGPATPPSACAHLNCHLLPACRSLSSRFSSFPHRERQAPHQHGLCGLWLLLIVERERESARVAREESEKGARGGYSHPIEYWGQRDGWPARPWPCRALPPLAGVECAGVWSSTSKQGLPHDDGGVLQNSVPASASACMFVSACLPVLPVSLSLVPSWSMQYSKLQSHLVYSNAGSRNRENRCLSPSNPSARSAAAPALRRLLAP